MTSSSSGRSLAELQRIARANLIGTIVTAVVLVLFEGYFILRCRSWIRPFLFFDALGFGVGIVILRLGRHR